MKKIFYYFLVISILFCSTTFAQRYKSLSERSGQSSSRAGDANRFQRYESKSTSDKQKFDQNLNRYNRYSPSEKKQATEKWRNFKENTTPEERQYIMEKMRNRRQDGGYRSRRQ